MSNKETVVDQKTGVISEVEIVAVDVAEVVEVEATEEVEITEVEVVEYTTEKIDDSPQEDFVDVLDVEELVELPNPSVWTTAGAEPPKSPDMLLLSNGVSVTLAEFEGEERSLIINAVANNSNSVIEVRLTRGATLTVAKSQIVGLIEE